MFSEVFVCPQVGTYHPWGVPSLAGRAILSKGVHEGGTMKVGSVKGVP